MSFNSLWFVFAVLPAVLLLHYLLPKVLRNFFLVLVSFVFYAWGNPQYLVLLAISLVFNYLSGLEIGECRRRERYGAAKFFAVTAVIVNLLVLGYFKYAGFLLENINALFATEFSVKALPLPLGISFFTFTALSYILDVSAGREEEQRDPLAFALYMSFFPKIMSGPIVRYEEIAEQLHDRTFSLNAVGRGAGLFFVGLMKKVLLADNLGTAFASVQALSERSSLTAILGMVFYSLELYYDFSGYSDMAIGLARMFGFRFEKNFDHPYLSKNVSEFWRRWHISLGSWFREYVYIPLGGNRCGAFRQLINLLVVWILTGLWHGASWNFLVWGLWHGLFIILERFVFRRAFDRVPAPIRICFTTVIAFFGWVFFFSPSLGEALHYISQIFGSDGLGFADSFSLYCFAENRRLLFAAFLLCGPFVSDAYRKIRDRRMLLPGILIGAVFTVLLAWCIASMVGATYTTFLYFQF